MQAVITTQLCFKLGCHTHMSATMLLHMYHWYSHYRLRNLCGHGINSPIYPTDPTKALAVLYDSMTGSDPNLHCSPAVRAPRTDMQWSTLYLVHSRDSGLTRLTGSSCRMTCGRTLCKSALCAHCARALYVHIVQERSMCTLCKSALCAIVQERSMCNWAMCVRRSSGGDGGSDAALAEHSNVLC